MRTLRNLIRRNKVNKHLLNNKLLIGWSEWCQLPQLGVPAIKAKIDTGARTSAIHAFNIKSICEEGKKFVHFDIHPIQRNNSVVIKRKALIVDERYVMSSNGHKEHRYVILTTLQLGKQFWDIELTLSNRDPLMFRMLLGRKALDRRVIIDPSKRYKQGKINKRELLKLYSFQSQDGT